MERTMRVGTLAYDVGQTPSQPVIVTDPNKGTVSDQDSALQDLIMNSSGNNAFPMDYDTDCIEVQYLSLDGAGKRYTMPETRIAVPEMEIGPHALGTAEFAVGEQLYNLCAEAEVSDGTTVRSIINLCRSAGVPAPVIAALETEFRDELSDESEGSKSRKRP